MKTKLVVIGSLVALCGAAAIVWYATRPEAIVPPTAALYDGAVETAGDYQVTKFNADGKHRVVVNVSLKHRKGRPGTYPLAIPHDGVHIMTTQYDSPLPQYVAHRGPLDYLLQLFSMNRSRDKVAQWLSQTGQAVVTIHTAPGQNGRYLVSVELKDLVLVRESGTERSTIDSLTIGPVEFRP